MIWGGAPNQSRLLESGKNIPDGNLIWGVTQFLASGWVPKQTCGRSQRLQVLVIRNLGSQKQIDQVNSSAVNGIILDRRRQTSKHRNGFSDCAETGVWQGDTLADTGATNPLTLLQCRQ